MCKTTVTMKNLWAKKDMLYQNNSGKLYEKHSAMINANGISKKAKRFRSAFTTEQVTHLETKYKQCPYVDIEHRTEIAAALNIPERAVKIWFQNRRMKEKKESTSKEFCEEISQVIQPVEFVKKRLNNVITMQSANDQSLNLLPLLTADVKHTAKSIVNNNVMYADTYRKAKEQITSKHFQNVNQNKPGANLLTFLKSRGLQKESRSTLNLNSCQKHKKDNNRPPSIVKNNLPVNNQPPSFVKSNFSQQIPPEDLSATKHVPKQEQTSIRHGHCMSGYIPVVPTFYPQPFVSPEGILWKPVKVLPMMAGPQPMSKDFNINSTHQQNSVPKMCNCDCHMKSYPIMGHQNTPSPHYFFTALPLKQPST